MVSAIDNLNILEKMSTFEAACKHQKANVQSDAPLHVYGDGNGRNVAHSGASPHSRFSVVTQHKPPKYIHKGTETIIISVLITEVSVL